MPGQVGRPSLYTPEIVDEVCEWLSEGKTLRDYCRQEGKPARRTIDRWRAEDPIISARIARARDEGFDVIAEHALAIADDSTGDTIETESGTRMDSEWVARSKLRIETRLKLLAKWDPRRYGDRPVDAGAADEGLREFVEGILQRRPKAPEGRA